MSQTSEGTEARRVTPASAHDVLLSPSFSLSLCAAWTFAPGYRSYDLGWTAVNIKSYVTVPQIRESLEWMSGGGGAGGGQAWLLLSCAKIRQDVWVCSLSKAVWDCPHTSPVLEKQILDMMSHTKTMLFITKKLNEFNGRLTNYMTENWSSIRKWIIKAFFID